MCHILPDVWLDKLGCVEPLSLVPFIHVPRNCILFESIPEGKENKCAWVMSPPAFHFYLKHGPLEELHPDYRPPADGLKSALSTLKKFCWNRHQVWKVIDLCDYKPDVDPEICLKYFLVLINFTQICVNKPGTKCVCGNLNSTSVRILVPCGVFF